MSRSEESIAVLGAGVIGLSTALLLLHAGERVTIYAHDMQPDVTSSRAGAIWLPILNAEPGRTPPNYDDALERWATTSWHHFRALVDRGFAVRPVQHHEMFTDTTPPPAYLADLAPDLIATLDDTLPAAFTYRWSFRSFVIDMPRYMAQL